MSEEEEVKGALAAVKGLAEVVITTIKNAKKRSLDKRTSGFYKSTIEKLNNYWNQYTEAYINVQTHAIDAGKISELQTSFNELDLKYSDYISDLHDGLEEKTKANPENTELNLESTQQGHQSSNFPSSSNVQLPRIQLPKFDGKYDNWRAFHDLFVSVVHHDSNLEPVQKLHYLKGCLTGDAERLLKNIPITNDDYMPAWDKLKQRFENKRIIVNTQVKKLINQEKLKAESSRGLQSIIDTTEECLQQIKILKVDVSSWDTLLIHILVKRLPIETIQLWEEELGDNQELPKLNQFLKFLQTRSRVLECVSSTIGTNNPAQQSVKTYYVSKNDKESKCPMCQEKHYLAKCEQFNQMDVTRRREFIRQSKRCFNCLSDNHTVKNCKSKYSCRRCNRRHSTWLHIEDHSNEISTEDINTREKDTNSNVNQVQNFFNAERKTALLATAQVAIRDQYGHLKKVRCLVDPGSQASFITENMADQLGLKRSAVCLEISGLNGNQTACVKSRLNTQLISCTKTEGTLTTDLLIINRIAETLPTESIRIRSNWNYLNKLELADPFYWKTGPVDILLGAEPYTQIIQNGLVKGVNGGPTAINTLFGWILLGGSLSNTRLQSFATYQETIDEINQTMKKFWETEEVPHRPTMTEDEKKCENHYEATHTRLPNGQYQVRLPFKESPSLGKSRELAVSRFNSLERKFHINDQFKKEYTKCFDEYVTLGHMSEIKLQTNGYYIPHHAVFKDSSTTKLRIVFDASAKSSNRKSLNEQLLTGPTLQPKLFATLLKWRKHKIAITGDIEKMYRMIQIHPEDRQYQKVIWKDKNSNIKDFQLNTVTFGTTSAPYLAIKTLQQLSKDERQYSPQAARTVLEDFYVDDLLTGADTAEQARGLRDDCITLLKKGNFNLRKWSSNDIKLLNDLPETEVEMDQALQFTDDTSVKTLGINWVPKLDIFTFIVKNKGNTNQTTKRTILSEIASLYDPLGWIAPIIVKAKILMQEIWISGCNWDDEVSVQLKQKWITFKTHLRQIEMIKIPRWVGYTATITNIELHGFCDASMQAYGAVIYFCVEVNDQRYSTLLTAKTKVAPIKPVTIPRLELCGALLLAKLMKQTVQDMGLEAPTLVAWIDSTIVLYWIKSHPRKWKTYVANRVAEIQEVIKPEHWRYVPTKHNPADIASRGEESTALLTNKLWWNGPLWLTESKQSWPAPEVITQPIELEAKKNCTIALSICIDEGLFTRYSTFHKLKRIIATIKRFMFNCKNKKNKITQQITVNELNEATSIILRQLQKIHFKEEYHQLSKNQEINNNSKLIQLRPFLDANKVMRVGGRLQHADISYDQKHPIIVPTNHHVTNMIIRKIHEDTLHGGTSLVLNTSRQLYWIINAKRIIANQINRCPTCIRHRQVTKYQLMGNLPADRINISRTFENVGIDYAGPIYVKTSTMRNAKSLKSYFCIFICMATKAIHLEAVSSLSTEAFLAALKRFIARRGVCKTLYSDCGTNFKGAKTILDKELKEAIKQATKESIDVCVNKLSITWKFNPPGAPHFGGLWEANIKSVKYHMLRVIGKQSFTFEEFATLLTQIEAMLNSRPLCKIENSLEDLEVLTPGHFLIGQPLNTLPEQKYTEHETIHRRWKHIQYLTQQFWKKWSRDYLNTLQHRPKWYKPQPNMKEGDIVILKDDQTSPTLWPLGRITKIYPGRDNRTRVVDVKTTINQYTRPITKLCPLPMEPN